MIVDKEQQEENQLKKDYENIIEKTNEKVNFYVVCVTIHALSGCISNYFITINLSNTFQYRNVIIISKLIQVKPHE